jgi:mevalonate pyrophosphate decarboxylase
MPVEFNFIPRAIGNNVSAAGRAALSRITERLLSPNPAG